MSDKAFKAGKSSTFRILITVIIPLWGGNRKVIIFWIACPWKSL
jgi:hypothetical protein